MATTETNLHFESHETIEVARGRSGRVSWITIGDLTVFASEAQLDALTDELETLRRPHHEHTLMTRRPL